MGQSQSTENKNEIGRPRVVITSPPVDPPQQRPRKSKNRSSTMASLASLRSRKIDPNRLTVPNTLLPPEEPHIPGDPSHLFETMHHVPGTIEITQAIPEHGGFATITQGNWTDDKGYTRVVALKTVKTPGPSATEAQIDTALKRLSREYISWKPLNNEYIVPLFGVWMTRDGMPSFVMPWYERGSVFKYLEQPALQPAKNHTAIRLQLVKDIMNGLVFLHESQRVHGDLNPMNTLVDDSGKALIADFGFARIVDQFGFTTYNRSQDDMYGPPERAYYTGAGSPVKPTTEEDVWCFGMTALKIMTGKDPYGLNTTAEDKKRIIHRAVHFPPLYLQEWKELWWILQHNCWDKIPSSRLSMPDIKKRMDHHYGGTYRVQLAPN